MSFQVKVGVTLGYVEPTEDDCSKKDGCGAKNSVIERMSEGHRVCTECGLVQETRCIDDRTDRCFGDAVRRTADMAESEDHDFSTALSDTANKDLLHTQQRFKKPSASSFLLRIQKEIAIRCSGNENIYKPAITIAKYVLDHVTCKNPTKIADVCIYQVHLKQGTATPIKDPKVDKFMSKLHQKLVRNRVSDMADESDEKKEEKKEEKKDEKEEKKITFVTLTAPKEQQMMSFTYDLASFIESAGIKLKLSYSTIALAKDVAKKIDSLPSMLGVGRHTSTRVGGILRLVTQMVKEKCDYKDIAAATSLSTETIRKHAKTLFDNRAVIFNTLEDYCPDWRNVHSFT